MAGKSVVIIGAGISGLAAGCYAQMNGYQAHIVEMHGLPGGICTAWKRGGFTCDGSVHYLIGSAPGGLFNAWWRELGLVQGLQFFQHDTLCRVEGSDGRVLSFYVDPERLHQHLLELSPSDRPAIESLIAGVRFFKAYNPPVDAIPQLMGPLDGLKLLASTLPTLGTIQKWSKVTIGEFSGQFQDPLIRKAFQICLLPEFPMILLLSILGWEAQHNAGYPIGGSLPLARAIEQRFKSLGGEITYHARVACILTEGNRAAGVRLEDGRELRADGVISAADGRTTLFKLLDERFLDAPTRRTYQDTRLFPSLLYVNLGVNRIFDEPPVVSSHAIALDEPVEIAGRTWDYLPVRIVNFDPTFAPPGKTVLTLPLWTDYAYWHKRAADPSAYQAAKEAALQAVIDRLDRRWPGLAGQVEMADAATPLTYERYTGNWQGSPQGWLPTPQNALKQMSKTLPGLKDFYLIGQWTDPGGGLPNALRSGRAVVRLLCRQDKIRFTTTEA